tara:strand:+ start:3106 stop:4146 length:1041 start_codon:yes stop_codon:yes gene_type:complete
MTIPGLPNPSNFTDVLNSPSVWTGKDGVTAVTDILSNPALQDKIQLGLMKDSFNTLVKTGQIVTPATDTNAPIGQLYDAAANAGKNLISVTAGLVNAPKALSSGATGALSSALSGATGALSSALSGATGALSGALSGATGALSGVSNSLSSSGVADLGGLLANSSKFGVDAAVDWAKGTSNSAISAVSGIASSVTSSLSGLASSAAAAATSLKTQMDSLAKQGQFAVNFSDFKLPAAIAGVVPAPGFKATVDRSTLNSAFTKLVGSAKIATPAFSPQLVNTASLESAANKAKSLLSGSIPSLPGGLAGLSNSIEAGIGSLGDPNAPPYTGDDPIVRQRLGLPPVNQ